MLKRPVTSEELLSPGAPYARKTFTVGRAQGPRVRGVQAGQVTGLRLVGLRQLQADLDLSFGVAYFVIPDLES